MKILSIITSKIIAHVFGTGVSLFSTALYLSYSVRPANRRDDLTCLQLNAVGVRFFRTSEFLFSYLTHPRRKKRLTTSLSPYFLSKLYHLLSRRQNICF
jgi:hypothetical protein